MKINWILPEASQCGGIRIALQYANAFVELGHDVVCYVPKSGQHYGWKKLFFLKEVLKMHKSAELRGEWFDNKFKFEFPVWITNHSVRDADVTIATSWITSYWTYNLSSKKGKKVYFIQDFETWGTQWQNQIVRESYRLKFDEYITVSTSLHNRLLKDIGTESKIVCNGVESCFLKMHAKKNYDDIVIGMPYRDVRGNDIKNCALGIRVMLKVKEHYPSIQLVTFGFKKPENWNREIEFIENPARQELVKLYANTAIFYVPSIYEGWGLPAMEAMAQENVVLAGYSGGIQEIGVDKKNCIVLDNPRDEQEAVGKIEKLIINQQEREIIGRNARKTVSEMSDSISSRKFEKVLKDICCLD